MFTNFFDAIASAVILVFFGWSLYHLPVLIVGLKGLQKSHGEGSSQKDLAEIPVFSIIVPMRNEARVAGRCLETLLKLNYPPSKFEIVVVDDASTDETSTICREFADNHPTRIKYLRLDVCEGKSVALNHALGSVKGNVVAVFDADSVPEADTLIKVAKRFQDSSVAAVQGLVHSINADQNMWTKLMHYEGMLRFQVFMQGKNDLGLFVPLAGTCQFVRRQVLENIGGWRARSLSEDMELSARLMEKGYATEFAPEIRSWEENPASLGAVLKQRLRWARGSMEVGLRYGRLVKHLNRKSLDAEIFFLGPFVLVFSIVGYALGIHSIFSPAAFGTHALVRTLAQLLSVFMWTSLFVAGLTLVYGVKPRRLANVKWVPIIYLYWSLLTFVALFALGQMVFRRPRKWQKTTHSGKITNHILE